MNNKIINSFLKNLNGKKFENNNQNNYQKEFWQKIAPYLDEEVLEDLNRDLIDEKMKKLKK